MDYNSKNYELIKLKKLFKANDFFFLFHSAKLNLNQWVQTEQKLKKSKLKYLKVLNGTGLRLLKNSVYKKLIPIVYGFIIYINLNFQTTKLNLSFLKNDLKPFFELITVKLNSKIYSISQLKEIQTFSYQSTVFNLHQSLDRYLKIIYLLTQKNTTSK